MLKIRLMRIGAKKKPFYRVVATHERSKRTGGYVELLGTYNPLTEPKEIKLKQDRIDHWVKQGAQMSEGFLRIIGKAPQRPPRKAKKPARNASQSDAGGEAKKTEAPAAEATPAEQPNTDQPAEEATGPQGETVPEQPNESSTEEAPAQEAPVETPASGSESEPAAPTEEK